MAQKQLRKEWSHDAYPTLSHNGQMRVAGFPVTGQTMGPASADAMLVMHTPESKGNGWIWYIIVLEN